MAREKKVVDASVVVKVFLHEGGSEKAQVLIQEHVSGKTLLIAPELIFLEVLNALRYKRADEEALARANKFLWGLQFHSERLHALLLEQAALLALRWDLTLYDAVYLALSHNFGVPLITADKKLAKVPGVMLL